MIPRKVVSMGVSFAFCVVSGGAGASCGAADPSEPSRDGGMVPDDVVTLADAGWSGDSAPSAVDGAEAGAPATYTNPVLAKDFPDPFVLRDGAVYYAFSTNAGGKNVPVATSTDLALWTELADALPTLPSWAQANASLTWAPSVLRRGTTYVLYYTARSKVAGFQCIGRAVANTAAGPYADDSSEPFICQVSEPQALCGSIDASPFVAPNGDAYLLWKSDENAAACGGDARLWTQRLGIDGLSLLDAPTELLRRDRSWESPLIEGPSMVEFEDVYFLFYSANWWEGTGYGIGYAVCASPRGPCTKKTLTGPLVKSKGDVLGPGGQEVFKDAEGKTWMAYHAWSAPIVGYANGGRRSLRIDPVDLRDGVPSFAGPTTTARPL
jgi:beta-xylosidase